MRLLVCGDRFWSDKDAIKRELRYLIENHLDGNPTRITLIEGACSGADLMSAEAARELGVPEENILEFPAQWATYGKTAGPIRNRQMLTEGKPELVYAFHKNIKESRGTKDMISATKKAGIPCVLFTK